MLRAVPVLCYSCLLMQRCADSTTAMFVHNGHTMIIEYVLSRSADYRAVGTFALPQYYTSYSGKV